jgi:mannose-1-phosphate guanylyltransferase/mannose-6-phosphate isomerase
MTFLILAGGSGKRLFPLSRETFPKQFLPLFNGRSLLEETLSRTDGKRCLIVGSSESVHLLKKASKKTAVEVLAEPCGRNTAPAIVFGLTCVDDEEIVAVMPADHYIQDRPLFQERLQEAEKLAGDGYIVTLGICPDAPETGYGYIKKGRPAGAGYVVDSFTEKPDEEKARVYLDSGDYLWNSGMFIFKKKTLLEEFKNLSPQLYDFYEALSRSREESFQAIYQKAPDISIDYAVMEKTKKAVVIPSDFGWSDIGSWRALKALFDPGEGNVSLNAELFPLESRNNIVSAPGKTVGLLDVDNLVVADTKDFLFIGSLERSQEVKEIVSIVGKKYPETVRSHKDEMRPWGEFTTLEEGDGFKVKKITVSPGEKLSLQYHHHREEHWIIVQGEALMTLRERTFSVKAGDTVAIPRGETHTIEGVSLTIFIEVQRGDYLGEDDIVRLDDRYGRIK